MAKLIKGLEINIERLMEGGETTLLQAQCLSGLREIGNKCGIEVYEHQSRPFYYCFRYFGEKNFFKEFLTEDEAKEYLENEQTNEAAYIGHKISHGSAICPWNAEGMRTSDFVDDTETKAFIDLMDQDLPF